jgi:hypothetical protein
MFWCNCVESWLALGRKIGKRTLLEGFLNFHQVAIHPDHTCVHCGYHTVYSKFDPSIKSEDEQSV